VAVVYHARRCHQDASLIPAGVDEALGVTSTGCNAVVAALSGVLQGSLGTIPVMYRARVFRAGESDRAQNLFAVARERVIDRLVVTGMPRAIGESLIDEWLRSTDMLTDFQAAPDFWQLAYRFATEEYSRRPRRI
jgi:hypothetical protein